MANPRLLLLDEPSMGLAPVLVDNIFDLGMSVEDATKKACDTISKQLNK